MAHQIITNSINTLAVLKLNGFSLISFETRPFSADPKALQTLNGHRPADVQSVVVVESWVDGGLAEIAWTNGQVEQIHFGKRKPSTTIKATVKGVVDNRHRNWRRRG